MTGPAVEQGQLPTYPVSLTLEQMEESAKAETAPTKPAEVRLVGDAVPEEFRGKTLADVLEFQNKLKTVLASTDAARKEAQERADRAVIEAGRGGEGSLPRSPLPTTEPKPALTREALKKMHAEDPIAAMEAMAGAVAERLVENFEKRTAGLSGAGATVAEQQARGKFPTEFAVLGPEIEAAKAEVADKALLADPNNWERVISYVRGKPGNYEKLQEHQRNKAAEEARVAQAAAAGPTVTGTRAPASTRSAGALDDYQKEIARGLGMSEAEYLKWK